MSLKNSQFYQNLGKSGDALLEQRALIVAEDTEYAQREIIDKIKRDIRGIDSEVVRLEDLGRTSNDSLQILNGDYDSAKWTATMQELGERRTVLEVKLKVAEKNYERYFGSKEEA